MAGLVPAMRPIEGALDLLAEKLWILFGNEMPRVLGDDALNGAGFLNDSGMKLLADA